MYSSLHCSHSTSKSAQSSAELFILISGLENISGFYRSLLRSGSGALSLLQVLHVTVKQGLVLLVLQLDYLELVLAAHEAGQLDGSNHYHYKLSHFDKQSLVKVSARAVLMKKSPLHHL